MFHAFRFSPALAAMAAFGWAVPATAQTADAASTNNAYFEDAATIVGGMNSITLTRVPVSAGGKTYYWDIIIPFLVDSDGAVVVQPVDEVKSVNFVDSAFEAGSYVGPPTILSGEAKIALAGPSTFNGSSTEWTISTSSGASVCTYPASAAFYAVPALSDNPIYLRLKKAGITSNAWSYGTAGSTGCYATWPPNGIIGVSQVGNTLTIASFSSYAQPDSNTPVAQITYTLK